MRSEGGVGRSDLASPRQDLRDAEGELRRRVSFRLAEGRGRRAGDAGRGEPGGVSRAAVRGPQGLDGVYPDTARIGWATLADLIADSYRLVARPGKKKAGSRRGTGRS